MVRRDASIVVFCTTFFQQFLRPELGHDVTSISQDFKAEATRRRLELQRDGGPSPTTRLIRLFEDYCDRYTDILGITYPGSANVFRDFHRNYVPPLLTAIVAWAKERHDDDLVKQAELARDSYTAAVKHL